MAGLFGLLGGGGSDPLDIYGDLFSPEQKAALQRRSFDEGLLKMAGAFGKAAQPSRLPTSFMGALGEAAGAMSGSGDQAAESALKAMKVGEDVRSAKQRREWTAKVLPMLMRAAEMEKQYNLPEGTLTRQVPGAPGAPAAPATPATPAAPVAPLGGGDLGGYTGTPGTTGDFPTGAPPPAEAPALRDWSTGPEPAPAPVGMGQRGGIAPGTQFNSRGEPISPDLTTNFPGQKSGAALPPGIRFPAGPATPPPAGQQNTGLLPPQDQVVGPDGQPLQGPGVLPNIMAASYGDGANAPLPFARASSASTGAAPAGGPRGKAIDYFTRQGWTREQAAGIAANLEAESSWRKDVPGDGGQAFGYAQWHPPRQEQFKRVFGKDIRNATEEEQLAFVNWELNNTEKAAGDRLRNATNPRDAAAVVSTYYERPADREGNAARRGALAEQIQGGGDYVIPSGRGVPRSALRNVADTGAAPGRPAAPAGGGVIPGLNMTPQQAGAMGAITEILGLDNPFKSILDTYYKSPGYLEEASGATEKGKDPYVRGQAKYTSDLTLGREMITRGVVLNPDGSLGVRPGFEALSAAENAKFTGDIKEYEYYRRQELAAGQIPDSFQKWQSDAQTRKAPVTNINTAEGLEAKRTMARVEVDKTVALDAAKKASLANESLPLIDEMIRLADKTPGGWAGQVAATTAKAFSALGFPVTESMSNAEAMQAVQQRMIPPLRDPGSTSDKDMSLYLAASPGLANSVEGRLKMAGLMRAMAIRNIEIADVYQDTIGLPVAERRARISALNAKPLFTEEQRAAMNAAITPATPAAPVQTRPGGSTPLPGGGAEAPLPPPPPTDRATYDKLPPGSQYIAPDGSTRTKR